MFKYLLACVCLFTAWNSVAQTRVIAEASYIYDSQLGMDVSYDSVTYNYSSGRGGAVNEPLNYDTSVWYSVRGNPWVSINERYIKTYNAVNLLTAIDVHKAEFGEWVAYEKTKRGYNSLNQLLGDTTWQVGYANRYIANPTYTPAGNYDTVNSYTLNRSQKSSVRRSMYMYDANNNMVERINQSTEEDTFFTISGSYNYYNAGNLCTLQVNKKLSDPVARIWEEADSYMNEYDVNNNLTVQYKLEKNASGDKDTLTKTTNYYDNSNLLVGRVVEWKGTGIWQKQDSAYMTYNADRHCTSKRDRMEWDGAGWVMDGSVYHRYYYQSYDPNNIQQLSANPSTLQVWPVPSSGNIHLHLQEASQKQYVVAIYDMQGRQVMQDYYFSNTTQSFNTNTLPAGNYNLILKGDKGGVQHSKFTVVK